MPFGLSIDTISQITRKIAENPNVNKIILFGSRAKGNPRQGSDIDLAVWGNSLSLNDLLEMSVKMEKMEIAYKVDIIHFEKTENKDVLEHIRRVGIILYREGKFRKYGLPPLIGEGSRILILGSFPSEKSLSLHQYYANPSNAFWKVLLHALEESVPDDYNKRLGILQRHGIALWDVIESCFREGSSDKGISDALPNDFTHVYARFPSLTHLLFNGTNTLARFSKLRLDEGPLVSVPPLPSTSSLNTHLTLQEKIERWQRINYIPSQPPPPGGGAWTQLI